ncbi:MAG: type IV pilus modification protein PilV [Janthinobacterium lividum]
MHGQDKGCGRGFTLVEVLVALFVLAVGIVGAGAVQLTAERTRQQASLRSEAAQLAASLAARMRVNPAIATLPDAGNPYLSFSHDAAGSLPAAPARCFGDAACSPAALAQFDLHEVRQALHAHFPHGRAVVCRDASPWDAATQAYRWQCDGDAAALPVVKLGWQGAGEGPGFVMVLK